MASWCAVTVIVLRIIILLLSEQFCFESQSYATDSKFEEIKAMFFKELKDPDVLLILFVPVKYQIRFTISLGIYSFEKIDLAKKVDGYWHL